MGWYVIANSFTGAKVSFFRISKEYFKRNTKESGFNFKMQLGLQLYEKASSDVLNPNFALSLLFIIKLIQLALLERNGL